MKDVKFMLGANYWGSKWATDMWCKYDKESIRDDLKTLAEYGVKNLRVFPNWRDFQPVDKAYAWRGKFGEYVNANTGEPVYDDGVDMQMIENFRDFCHVAEANGIELSVSIVTGWMSGKLFTPPVLNGKNLINDPEALMWMRRYIKKFVAELKNEKAIVAWGLGNECNCLSHANNMFEAYQWTATVVDAIHSEDQTRPIDSGMHGLASGISDNDEGNTWFIEHQGELTDMLCTHPYPSPTVGGDVEPYTRMRTTCLPTAQTLYYAGVSKKPAYIQESGTFSQTIGSDQMSSDFMRIQILSSIAHNFKGYQWWCAWNQNHLEFPPYTWAMIERELGMFEDDHSPKPGAYVMKAMSELVDKLPDPFPKRAVDGVCLLSRAQNRQHVAISSVLFAKQAGLDIDVTYTDNGDFPDSKLYFMPCISGWQIIYKKTWNTLLEKVKNGATLCLTFDGGQITKLPEVVGAESMGFMNNVSHTVEIDGDKIPYTCKEVLLNPTTAEVLLRNEEGNPVFTKNKYGEGTIYFINIPMERLAFEGTDLYNKLSYYKFYKEVAKDIIENKIINVTNKEIGVTINPISDSECYAVLLNYHDQEIKPQIKLDDKWEISEVVYGDINAIPMCNATIVKVKKK